MRDHSSLVRDHLGGARPLSEPSAVYFPKGRDQSGRARPLRAGARPLKLSSTEPLQIDSIALLLAQLIEVGSSSAFECLKHEMMGLHIYIYHQEM